MGLTTSITTKGQVTIPAEIRHLMGLGPHDKVTFVIVDNQVHIVPATSVVGRTAGMLSGKAPVRSPQEEKADAEAAIAEEAGRRERV